jgi:hypothetical protein
MPEGRPGLGCRSSIRPAVLGGMVIYDRDWTGSIKIATTPPADGGQTPGELAPGHVRARSRRHRAGFEGADVPVA